MKVLLDENLPHKLRPLLLGHDVWTVAYAGWSGVKNGELITLAEAGGFDVFVTADRGLRYQQDLTGRMLAIVFLTAQDWDIISQQAESITRAIGEAQPGSWRVVECGRFTRT